MAPDVSYEQQLLRDGYSTLAGIDEAGRGCWAGPVVAAAVVLHPRIVDDPSLLAGVDDSKKLTAHQRDATYERIVGSASAVGVGCVPAFIIDLLGIVPATRLAMTVALLSLPCIADALLIDALPLHDLSLHQTVLIRGDGRSLSIAAASIVAKVFRDRLMHTAEHTYPGYGFSKHKGYGTAVHQQALARLGPCALHRLSYRPVLALTTDEHRCRAKDEG